MAREIPVTQARADLADLVNRVAYTGERIMLTRHGRPLAALVPVAELEALERRGDTDAEAGPEPGAEIGFGLTQVAAASRSEVVDTPEPADPPEPAEPELPAGPRPPAGPLRIAAHYRPPQP